MPLTGLGLFREKVLNNGRALYRDLAWRRIRDPYAIWVSEVMLQQTQVTRVEGRWQRWMDRFPSVDALAAADVADVLDEWQGMGYNRRALALLRAAKEISSNGGEIPRDATALRALPGIGPATAAGIRAFAYNLPGIYLETNVRAVFLHELFPDATDVPDSVLMPLVEKTCPDDDHDPEDDPRTWYYALLDYGAHLKKTLPNPSRRSRSHVRQTKFEGSHRQRRAAVVRALLAFRAAGMQEISLEDLTQVFSPAGGLEAPKPPSGPRGVVDATHVPIGLNELHGILMELESEGFCTQRDGLWSV